MGEPSLWTTKGAPSRELAEVSGHWSIGTCMYVHAARLLLLAQLTS